MIFKAIQSESEIAFINDELFAFQSAFTSLLQLLYALQAYFRFE